MKRSLDWSNKEMPGGGYEDVYAFEALFTLL